jgi:adenylate kinase family enzyme
VKILITGNAGAGKSTLAKRLAAERGLPFFSLDSIVWWAGWKKTPVPERDVLVDELIARDSWVVDGVSTRVLQVADVVIFLDVQRWRCLWQAARRNVRYLFSSRPELPERLFAPTILRADS